ncbi:MAG TPA: hypothetical protein VFS93_07870 [Terrimesophilobacter sp.]|nr:hypothetical protein [Terrimesophilobacter sp.]
MIRLLVRTTDLLLRKLTHTANHPRARLPVYLGLLAGGLVASGWFTIRNYVDMVGAPPAEQLFAALIAVAIGYVMAGPVVLTAELTRDRSGRFEAALAPLPLTRQSTHVLVWGPVLLLIALILVLLLPPSIATLRGAGLPLVDAVSYAGVSLALGTGTAALSVLVVSLVLAGGKWKVVRAPVCFLVWAAIIVVQIVVAVNVLMGEDIPLRFWLLFPEILRDLSEGAGLDPVIAIAGFTVSVIIVLGLFFISGERFRTVAHGKILVSWTVRFRRNRLVGELLYALREANILANLVTCALLTGGALYLAHRLPQQMHHQLLPLAMTFILLCAGIPSRGLRGTFPGRVTPQQAMGMTAGSWFVTQNVVALALFLLVGAPAAFLPGAASGSAVMLLLALAIAVFTCSTVSGWLLVVRNENSLGQVLITLVYLAIGAGVAGFMVDLWSRSAPIALGLAVVLWATGSAGSFAMERWRWRYLAA